MHYEEPRSVLQTVNAPLVVIVVSPVIFIPVPAFAETLVTVPEQFENGKPLKYNMLPLHYHQQKLKFYNLHIRH